MASGSTTGGGTGLWEGAFFAAALFLLFLVGAGFGITGTTSIGRVSGEGFEPGEPLGEVGAFAAHGFKTNAL